MLFFIVCNFKSEGKFYWLNINKVSFFLEFIKGNNNIGVIIIESFGE